MVFWLRIPYYAPCVCRKQKSQYTFIGPGVVDALPQESLNILMDSAQCYIEKISNLDTITVSLNISMWKVQKVYLFVRTMTDVWQPSDRLFAKSLQDWKNVQLTAENFEKDLFNMIDLQQLSQFTC